VAAKVAEVAFAATVTEAGMVRAALFLESATAAPPDGAALLSVIVQTDCAPELREDGEQPREETTTGATRVTVDERVAPPAVAEMVAAWSAETLPATAEKEKVDWPCGTTIWPVTGNCGLSLANVTARPPVGAAAERPPEHDTVAPAATDCGEHDRDDTVTGTMTGAAIVPAAPVTLITLASPQAAEAFVTFTDTELTPGAIDDRRMATTPLPTALLFNPKRRQLTTPSPVAQVTDLPAVTAAGPASTVTPPNDPAWYANVHCTTDGSIPLGTVAVRASSELPSRAAVAELRLKLTD
jgi:hypothetical protein